MQTTENNLHCVHVTTDDNDGHRFMDVTLPTHAAISINRNGVIHVNVNESCVFRLCKAGSLTIENTYTSHDELATALKVAINTVECASLDTDGNELPWYKMAKLALRIK